MHQNTLSHQIPDHVFTSVQLQSNISLSLMSTQTLDFPTDHKCLLHVTYQPIPSDSSPPTNWPSEPFSDNQPIRFHVQRLKQPDIANQFREHWGLIEALLISHKGAEKYHIDMLDSILCSSVQAIAERVLGVYKPGEARKKTDSSAQRLAKELDMSSSIQLLKHTQRASTVGVHMVSSTINSTPMEECIAHYTKMFNFPIPSSQLQSTQPASSVMDSESESQRILVSNITHDKNSLFAPIDESTLLTSQLLDRISPDNIKLQLARMSTTTSCGNDGISVIILRHLKDTTFIKHLCQLYYACIRKGETLKRWNEASIYPLCKDKGKPYTANNSRLISLLCFFCKIFESLILPTVRTSGNMAYSGIQAGFRSGYSTLTNVMTLHHLI